MTTGLHERVEYAISVCGKGFIRYRKAVFLEYVLLYSTHKIQKGYPYLVRISEVSKISKMAALTSHRIPQFPKFSKIPKFQKFQNYSKISKIPRPNAQENIRGNFLEILEFCAIGAAFLEILETCKEFSALRPRITASCPIVVLSWFKLSTKSPGKFKNCRNFRSINLGFSRLQHLLWTRTLDTGVEFTLDVLPPEQLRCGLFGGGDHIYIYIYIQKAR